MKRAILSFIVFVQILSSLYAQEIQEKNDWMVIGNVQYVTQHYWRGLGKGPFFGKAPAFEPTIAFTNGKWNLGVFSGASFDSVYKCMMPWVAYSPIKGLTIGLWDIYSPGKDFWHTNILDFSLETSKHFVDAMAAYKFPFNLELKAATLVFGGDANAEGKRNFTTYLETNYGYNWNNFLFYGAIGVTPWSGLYSKKAGIINLETKVQYTVPLFDNRAQLPIFIRAGYNPKADYFQFLAGAAIILPYNL